MQREDHVPSGEVTVPEGVEPIPADMCVEASNPDLVAEQSDLREALVHISFNDNPEVSTIVRSMFLIDREYVQIHGVKSITSVFKNCIIYDVAQCLNFKAQSISLSERDYINSLFQTHLLVIPIRGVTYKGGQYSYSSSAKIKFAGFDFKQFAGNKVFSYVPSSGLSIKGLILFGKLVTAFPPRYPGIPINLAHDFEELEASMQTAITTILDSI